MAHELACSTISAFFDAEPVRSLPDLSTSLNHYTHRHNTIIGVTTERGFTSHEHLDELGLIHMNGRVYDPLLGRFMTADPYVPDPADRQSFSRYSYVSNNPLGAIDPDGFWPGPIISWYNHDLPSGDSALGFGGRDSLNWEGDGSLPEPNGCPGCFDVPEIPVDRITITATRLDDFSWVPDATRDMAAFGGSFFGAGEYSNRVNGQWWGQNGRLYPLKGGPQPNQWTGSRSATVARANIFQRAGYVALGVQLTVDFRQGRQALQNDDWLGATAAGIDGGVGILTTLSGPGGWAVGLTDFVLGFIGAKAWFQEVLIQDFCIISGNYSAC